MKFNRNIYKVKVFQQKLEFLSKGNNPESKNCHILSLLVSNPVKFKGI